MIDDHTFFSQKIVASHNITIGTVQQILPPFKPSLTKGAGQFFSQGEQLFTLIHFSYHGDKIESRTDVLFSHDKCRHINLKGYVDTEGMFRTMKMELLWHRDWKGKAKLSKGLDKWIDNYNRNYLHWALGYRTPSRTQHHHYKTNEKR